MEVLNQRRLEMRATPRSTAASWHGHAFDRAWLHLVTILLCSLALFAYGISAGDLYRNETLRGYLAKECLRTGDFVVPRLYGEPLLTKPPGMYVFIALCSLPFGEVTTVSARLPSVIMATATVLALYWLLGRYLPTRIAWLIALLAPCFPLMLDKATSAEIDMVLVGWVTLAIAFYDAAFSVEARSASECGTGLDRRGSSHHLGRPSLALRTFIVGALCLAAGTLTKWTAVLYVYLTFIPLLGWRRQLRLLLAPGHLLAAGIVVLTLGAWIGAVVEQVGWETLKSHVVMEAAPRLVHSAHLEGHTNLHGPDEIYTGKQLLRDTLLHPLKVLGCTLPLGPLALLTLWPRFWRTHDERTKRLGQLLRCWALPNLVVFTLLPEHASRHSFPFCLAITALAGLWIADSWTRLAAAGHQTIMRWSVAAFLVCWLIAKVIFVQCIVPDRDHKRQPSKKAAALARLYPASETLYLNQVKDEGLMFYLNRDVRRVRDWSALPAKARALILTADEWQAFANHWPRPIQSHAFLKDSQNDTIVLVVLKPPAPS